jgi:hypothetical protein
MGAIARNIANKITTSGVFTSGAITNSSVTGITALANATDGITLISSQTASNSASINFTSGIDSTYKAYKFVFVNIDGANTDEDFQVNFSTDGGSNYNVTKTTTAFKVTHNEDDSGTGLAYEGGRDLAQSTSNQWLNIGGIGGDSDNNANGTLILFNPSSTSYVKHFISQFNSVTNANSFHSAFIAGYCNTTSAVNAVRFIMSGGNISAGKIYLYGIK